MILVHSAFCAACCCAAAAVYCGFSCIVGISLDNALSAYGVAERACCGCACCGGACGLPPIAACLATCASAGLLALKAPAPCTSLCACWNACTSGVLFLSIS